MSRWCGLLLFEFPGCIGKLVLALVSFRGTRVAWRGGSFRYVGRTKLLVIRLHAKWVEQKWELIWGLKLECSG